MWEELLQPGAKTVLPGSLSHAVECLKAVSAPQV